MQRHGVEVGAKAPCHAPVACPCGIAAAIFRKLKRRKDGCGGLIIVDTENDGVALPDGKGCEEDMMQVTEQQPAFIGRDAHLFAAVDTDVLFFIRTIEPCGDQQQRSFVFCVRNTRKIQAFVIL